MFIKKKKSFLYTSSTYAVDCSLAVFVARWWHMCLTMDSTVKDRSA